MCSLQIVYQFSLTETAAFIKAMQVPIQSLQFVCHPKQVYLQLLIVTLCQDMHDHSRFHDAVNPRCCPYRRTPWLLPPRNVFVKHLFLDFLGKNEKLVHTG